MKEYNPKEIENKWQENWEENNIFKSENTSEKENYYTLEMFAYPSGNLHVGHLRNYTIGDAIARYKKMKGFNILHPFGWDSFGLPAENAAIENKTHPSIWTKKNIDNMKRQLKLMGISHDWSREFATYQEDYYKWNQWIFIEMYKKGLVYKKKSYVNWCPECNTVLANEQVEDGKCWRHSKTDVIQKELDQWYFKITDYAEELLTGHKELGENWPKKVITMQKNWIGKSYGVEIKFTLEDEKVEIPAFTTRADTLYGVTYLVLAPEHPVVENIILRDNPALKVQVEAMINEDKIERTAEDKEKEGFFTGKYVINPINGEKLPLWIGNYVLMDYGTGAVMAVPAHDGRDFLFSKKYNIPMKIVIESEEEELNLDTMTEAYGGDGLLVNSGEFNGINNQKAKEIIADHLEKINGGHKTTNYRLHDWLLSRQRYWGTPIPALYCEKCGIVMEDEAKLPVKLPMDIEFLGVGNPLETSEEFKTAVCPKCGGPAKRETDTMDTFVDSSWYYLRFLNPHLDTAPFNKTDANNWTPVDQYIGGVEHAVMHLLYARFFHKVLRDLGLLDTNEPFKRLLTQGMVLGVSYYSENERRFYFEKDVEMRSGVAYSKSTGEELVSKVEKMSKSKNNGLDPEDIVKEHGADSARVFTLFAAPPEKELEWNMNGLAGAYRFLNRLFLIVEDTKEFIESGQIDLNKRNSDDEEIQKKLHQTIKKVTESMEDNFHFNTAIAAIMELLNDMTTYKQKVIDSKNEGSESKKVWLEVLKSVILMLSPFAPHMADELWENLGQKGYTFLEEWPIYIEDLTKETKINFVIQVNGKLRDTVRVDIDTSKEELEKIGLASEKAKKFTEGKEIMKIIVVPNKLVNIVVK